MTDPLRTVEPARSLENDLAGVLNHYSQENMSNTPDFILAQFLLGCLATWNDTVIRREEWYGRSTATGPKVFHDGR